MKYLFFSILFLLCLQTVFSQTVEVPTSKKRIAEIQKQQREDDKARKLYFDEDRKCRDLTKARVFFAAETSCRLVITYAEKLSEDSYISKSSAYSLLALVFLWQEKSVEAIPLLNKSLELRNRISDETDAEIGEIYFLLGISNFQLGKTKEAREYYTKAETVYRTAFKEMGDSEIREFYPPSIINILEAHLNLLKNAGLDEEAVIIEKRLAEAKIEFAEFLDK